MSFARASWTRSRTRADGVTPRVVDDERQSGDGSLRARECARRFCNYYNDYFGVPYPLPKLDQIAIPGGFGGAMENWGGITYYESALLFDPENSSAETQAEYLRSDRARDGAPVVRRSRHDGLVGQSLAERRIRLLDGNEVHREVQSGVGGVAAARHPARSDPARRHSEGSGDGRRRALDDPSDPASRSPPKRKRTAPSTTSPTERAVVHPHAREFSSAKKFSATAFANTSRVTNFRTPPRPIFGMRSAKPRANRSGRSPPVGRSNPVSRSCR